MSISYYPLINKIINTFNLRDRLLSQHAIAGETSFKRPFITVEREPGSGGRPIARAVAEKLGFTFVDEQIIDEIARSTKKRREIIQAVDEKSRTAIEDLVHSLLNREYIDDTKYVTELVRVVLVYAAQGNVVILGRAANFITPFAKGLHVRVTAPYKVRVQWAKDYEGVSEEKAKEIIAEVEQERHEFVKQYFRKNSTKANAYDVTINTTYFAPAEARDLIIEAFYKKFPGIRAYGSLLGPRKPENMKLQAYGK